MRSFRLWFCFALGLGFAAVMFLAPAGPTQAATPNTEQATRQLFQAVQNDDLPAAQASISSGADIDARNRWGMTPTDIAIDRGYYRIAHFLVSVRNQQRAPEAHAVDTPGGDSFGEESSPAAEVVPAHQTDPDTKPVPTPRPAAREETAPTEWPAGKPNPFDPGTPAPGAQLAYPPQASAQ